jgi:hypothetical protein
MCSTSQSGEASGTGGWTASSRLWARTIAAPTAASARRGSQISPASAIIEHPIAQMTWRISARRLKFQAKFTSVSSIRTSQAPRLSRKRETSLLDRRAAAP